MEKLLKTLYKPEKEKQFTIYFIIVIQKKFLIMFRMESKLDTYP